MNDLRILEQQQRESKRMLESMKLTKVHKLEQKKSIDVNLSNLKYQAGEMRAELQRANKELSKHHRQVLDARSRSEKSRKDSTRFDAKMKRAIGVARVLATYQNKVEAAMIGLNETNAKLNFKKGQMMASSMRHMFVEMMPSIAMISWPRPSKPTNTRNVLSRKNCPEFGVRLLEMSTTFLRRSR